MQSKANQSKISYTKLMPKQLLRWQQGQTEMQVPPSVSENDKTSSVDNMIEQTGAHRPTKATAAQQDKAPSSAQTKAAKPSGLPSNIPAMQVPLPNDMKWHFFVR